MSAPSNADDLRDFRRDEFTYRDDSKPVYRLGEGPGVVVMSEVPGITPRVADFSRRLVAAGFCVAMPDLFGKAGKAPTFPYTVNTISRACISREFSLFAQRGSSPVTDWCRALARDLHSRCGGPGVGAIGMCLTGNFALSLMLDPCLQAPVLSQPSLPIGLTKAHRAALHLSDEDLVELRTRPADQRVPILGLRFTHDALCPGARFARLREEFGEDFRAIEIDSSPRNPHGNPIWAHSVLTEHLIDEQGHPTRQALEQVLAFLSERLRPDSLSPDSAKA